LAETRVKKTIWGVSHSVFVLGIVSLLTDISSEMLVPVIPQFLKGVLGASGTSIGAIEGIAESTASLLRVWAGYLADRFGRPKLLTVCGYALSALSKPFLIFATAWPHVFAVRFADRFGKGIRSAPRDVLIAAASDENTRGRAFGLHRAMDTTGAMLGPVVVIAILWIMSRGHGIKALESADKSVFLTIFIVAAIPALLAVLVLAIFVPEQKRDSKLAKPPSISLKALTTQFKIFLAILVVFSIGNSSDAFLVLKATSKETVGMSLFSFMLVWIAYNALQAMVAFRSGILSDRIGRKPLIIAGWFVFSACYFAIAHVSTAKGIWLWYLIYGIYYGLTEGVLKAFAVDLAPAHLRGTALGVFHTAIGLALLPASLIAGKLWDINPSFPFYFGAITSLIAACGLILFVKIPAKNAPM